MARSYPVLLLAFAALWGANFALIKLAVDEVEPTTMGASRLLLAAVALLPLVLLRFGMRATIAQIRQIGWPILVVAFFNYALAFVLIAWGEKHIDSVVAAIANATMPLFVALIAIKVRESERASGLMMVGIIVGLGGVAVLVGFDPNVSTLAILGTLAVVLAALSYAVGVLYTQAKYGSEPALVLATVSTAAGGLILLPFGIWQAPDAWPNFQAWGSIVALGLGGTALVAILYYYVINRYGSLRTGFATYLLPVAALFYGVVLLDEPLTWSALVGLMLILAGVALGSDLVRIRRQQTATGRDGLPGT